MSLPSLLNTPKTPEEWARWSFSDAQDHINIIQAIQKQEGVSLFQYQLDPINFQSPFDFIRRHAQTHTDMNGVLGLQSVDLSEVDINDPNKLEAWIYSNYQEHNNAHEALGI